jgi:hypothetical protein
VDLITFIGLGLGTTGLGLGLGLELPGLDYISAMRYYVI